MGVDEGNLQVIIQYIDVDVILENCPITIDALNSLPGSVQYKTLQYHSDNSL